MRGICWYKMPGYKNENFLSTNRKLPKFFSKPIQKWTVLINMSKKLRLMGYAYHIQRLIVTEDFTFLVGIDLDKVNEWYLIVYGNVYEWVELPNATGYKFLRW